MTNIRDSTLYTVAHSRSPAIMSRRLLLLRLSPSRYVSAQICLESASHHTILESLWQILNGTRGCQVTMINDISTLVPDVTIHYE
jgi:hypothetical protein